mmetsp:Transcript_26352/g.42883  ORF Transcript_26352/g.42883 Transcript_26352/m.42883 type:complete len:125 (+) Transcript_26352:20-394(+)
MFTNQYTYDGDSPFNNVQLAHSLLPSFTGAMNISTAKCWSSEVNNPHPTAARELGSGASADGYEGGFGTALMLKDLNLAVDAGEEEGLALPVAGLSRDLYRMADLHGYGRRDFGVMLEFLKGVK